MAQKSVLGRGLGALIDNSEEITNRKSSASVNEIEIEKIDTNPWQPRTGFDEEKLNELASSIKELGIIQPLTLRKSENERYQIIAGERRFKAAQIAGLKKVPAFVRLAEDDVMLELALVENIQREDLDPIEIAISYQRLIDECKLTQENMSERIGKKRSTIANYLRLLKLPAEIQSGLRETLISMGHAKVILAVEKPETQINIYKQIIDNDLSVRKVEELVRSLEKQEKEEKQPKEDTQNDDGKQSGDYEKLITQLSDFFQTNIQFSRNIKGKGKIVIAFQTDEELEKIISILDKQNTAIN
jgi:ParB family chromosome partitioning protein